MKNERITVSYIFNNVYLICIALLTVFTSVAQKQTVVIPWGKSFYHQEGEQLMLIPIIDGGGYERGLPLFSQSFPLKNGEYTVSVSAIQSVLANTEDAALIAQEMFVVPTQPIIETRVGSDRGKKVGLARSIPYFLQDGQLKRIISFDISFDYKGAEPVLAKEKYVSSSVLSSGTWYKISVPKDGIYKLDKAFFVTMGVDVENLNPQHVNVYGNAFGRLTENNNGLYLDDLEKNAIFAFGEADGVFDEEDYFAFYGASPHRWEYNATTGFERDQHIYSDVTHYFIHIDDTDIPQRISSLSNAIGSPTHTVSSYTYRDIHELESTNLVKGGQRWYGELFDGELNQSISFSIPDLVTSNPIYLQYAVASNAKSSGNSFKFRHNGAQIGSQNLSSVSSDFARNAGFFQFNASSSNVVIDVELSRVNASVKGYLDYIEVTGIRQLKMTGSFFQFRDTSNLGPGKIGQFIVAGLTSNHVVWDVSNKRQPKLVTGTLTGSNFEFIQATDSLREFAVGNLIDLSRPTFVQAIVNQDLHSLGQVPYIIITHKDFLAQAERLGNLHTQNGTPNHVVTTEQIFNEFSSGTVDATAIRRFIKMFYDRANGVVADQPKNVLLFGDATYDPKGRVGNNNYYVPSFEVLYSEDHINAMVTDDYFGIMSPNGSIAGSDLMEVGVGRLLISNQEQAVQQVNKIEHYMKNGSQLYSGGPNDCCSGETNSGFGDWRLNYTLITDDEEGGYFINTDAEPVYNQVRANYPEFNSDKIYSDAFQQTSTAGGARYPDVFNAITERVERGSLIMNYIGHGGEVGAAEERIITIPQILSWNNINKLNVFVTATCEFTKFDDPSRVSAGELVSLSPTGGSIALMTTTRSVYFNVNSNIIEKFYEYVFARDANNDALTFGEIMRRTKNTSDQSNNRRSFNLIGDPALKIALPKWRIVTDTINGKLATDPADTIQALSKMRVTGHIEDFNGNVLTSFNGVLSPTIYDKAKSVSTLQNDPNSPVISFKIQKNALFKGKASVKNGYFAFEYIVPKDIDYSYGNGKLSYYANTTDVDADGLDTNFVVGGLNTEAIADNVGPEIELYLNDNNFVNGGITSSEPLLIVEARDDFGINTAGNGVGHDLVAIIDGETSKPIVLNDYYTSDLDQFQSGKIQYTLRGLAPGTHTVEVKIWDVNNNSNVARLEFVVKDEEQIELDHVLNYPNPFTTSTKFYFEHNQSCSSLETQIQIYTVSGRLVRTINKLVPTAGFRVEGIEWDGKDDFGDQLAKGVYVYRLSVELPEGGRAEKLEKLVLLK